MTECVLWKIQEVRSLKPAYHYAAEPVAVEEPSCSWLFGPLSFVGRQVTVWPWLWPQQARGSSECRLLAIHHQDGSGLPQLTSLDPVSTVVLWRSSRCPDLSAAFLPQSIQPGPVAAFHFQSIHFVLFVYPQWLSSLGCFVLPLCAQGNLRSFPPLGYKQLFWRWFDIEERQLFQTTLILCVYLHIFESWIDAEEKNGGFCQIFAGYI